MIGLWVICLVVCVLVFICLGCVFYLFIYIVFMCLRVLGILCELMP